MAEDPELAAALALSMGGAQPAGPPDGLAQLQALGLGLPDDQLRLALQATDGCAASAAALLLEGGPLPAPAAAGPHKLVLVARTDLGMSPGKLAAQCAHAAVDAVRGAPAAALEAWGGPGSAEAKVVLQCADEAALDALLAAARARGLPTHVVRDAGRTEVAAGSRTVLAVGPGLVSAVDEVTGSLRLY